MLAHPAVVDRPAVNRVLAVVSDRLTSVMSTGTNNTTVRATAVRSTVGGRVDGTGSLCHGASRTVRSVTGSAAPGRAVVTSPAGLVSEDCRVEAVEGVGAGSVDEGRMANKRDVVDWVNVSNLNEDLSREESYSGSPRQRRRSCGMR